MTIIRERQYTVDDVWELSHHPENADKYFYLIDGELYWDMPPGGVHGSLAVEIAYRFRAFLEDPSLGKVTVETGYHPPGARFTLLAPDVAFISHEAAPQPFPAKYVPAMPDLAVEILSPTDTIREVRRKARINLANGTSLVWIILPDEKSAEVCRADDDGDMTIEVVGRDGTLSGEAILPGFALELKRLFEFV